MLPQTLLPVLLEPQQPSILECSALNPHSSAFSVASTPSMPLVLRSSNEYASAPILSGNELRLGLLPILSDRVFSASILSVASGHWPEGAMGAQHLSIPVAMSDVRPRLQPSY